MTAFKDMQRLLDTRLATCSSNFPRHLPPNQLEMPLFAFEAPSVTEWSNLSMPLLISEPAFEARLLASFLPSSNFFFASADCSLSVSRSKLGGTSAYGVVELVLCLFHKRFASLLRLFLTTGKLVLDFGRGLRSVRWQALALNAVYKAAVQVPSRFF